MRQQRKHPERALTLTSLVGHRISFGRGSVSRGHTFKESLAQFVCGLIAAAGGQRCLFYLCDKVVAPLYDAQGHFPVGCDAQRLEDMGGDEHLALFRNSGEC
jgi:hypothetical protein